MDEDQVVRDVGKIWGALREFRAWAEGKFREFEVIMLGPDLGNGLKGDLRALRTDHADTKSKLDDLASELAATKAWGQHIWEVDRPEHCIGKIAVADLESRLKADADLRTAELRENRKVRLAMTGTVIVAGMTSITSIIVAIINQGAK
jgi:hypothetical protein